MKKIQMQILKKSLKRKLKKQQKKRKIPNLKLLKVLKKGSQKKKEKKGKMKKRNPKNLNVHYSDVRRKKNLMSLKMKIKRKNPADSYHSLRKSQYLKMMLRIYYLNLN